MQGFQYADGAWVPAATAPPQRRPHRLSIVTYNVLADSFDETKPSSFRSHLLCHTARQNHQLTLLKDCGADLIGLNEVTPAFLSKILDEPWVREHYTVSSTDPDVVTPFGNLLLSKYPLVDVEYLTLPRLKRRAVVAVCPFAASNGGTERVAVSAAHLTALGTNAAIRAGQLAALCRRIDELGCGCALVFGDLNFHRECENSAIPPSWADVWSLLRWHMGQPPAQKSDENMGYTFDAVRNAMVPELLPHFSLLSSVRMRLDRILLRDKAVGRLVDCEESTIQLFADQPVSPNGARPSKSWPLWLRVATLPVKLVGVAASLAGDAVGVNVLRSPSKYLYPSDHFGLQASLSLRNSTLP